MRSLLEYYDYICPKKRAYGLPAAREGVASEGAIKSEERRESKEREGEKGMFRLMFCENCLTTDIFK